MDKWLEQSSTKSRNPTGYLLQEYGTRPEATLERLERALSEIGMGEVYERLSEMLEEKGGEEGAEEGN